MTKGSKRRVQARETMVNANTHLVPPPLATHRSSRGSAKPQGRCILRGGGWGALVSCPEPLRTWDTGGPPLLLCFAGHNLGFWAQLAGSVAASAEGTAWEARVKSRVHGTREGVAAEHIWLGPPPGRTRRPPRSSFTLNSSTPTSPASIRYRLLRDTSDCQIVLDLLCALLNSRD